MITNEGWPWWIVSPNNNDCLCKGYCRPQVKICFVLGFGQTINKSVTSAKHSQYTLKYIRFRNAKNALRLLQSFLFSPSVASYNLTKSLLGCNAKGIWFQVSVCVCLLLCFCAIPLTFLTFPPSSLLFFILIHYTPTLLYYLLHSLLFPPLTHYLLFFNLSLSSPFFTLCVCRGDLVQQPVMWLQSSIMLGWCAAYIC